MAARYTIFVREYGSDHDIELMHCGSNPQAIVEGLRQKSLIIRRSIFEPGKRVVKIPKYIDIRVIDHEKEKSRR